MKKIKIISFSTLLFFVFNITALCVEGHFDKYTEEYYEIMSDTLSEDANEILEESGFDSIDFENILSAEPKDIISFFRNTAKGTIDSPLKFFITNCAVLTFVSVAFSYLSEDEKKKKSVTLIVYTYIAISVIVPMASLLPSAVASIKMSSNFLMVFLPILAGIIAASNNPLLALNYNSLTLYLAEAVSLFASNILVPFEGMVFALVSVNVISSEMRIKNLAVIIKNTVTKTLSLLATVFVMVLSIKGILSNIADSVAVKGAKLIVSSIVPVIGGSISDAYATIVNSLALLKSSVGVFGIAAIAAVNLPVIIELMFWSMSLTFSQIVADVFGLKEISSYFRDISDVIKTFNVIVIFCCMIFIISTGILLTIKNSVG